jgi:threonine aldolase
MREAMATAPVGDDVYGEDPSINKLQEMAAEIFGKDAGLFVASGTMGNLISVLVHCNRGDEIILGDQSHVFLFEAGGTAALGGVHSHTLPNQPDGTMALDDIRAAIRPDDPHDPITRLIILENTHNRCGGAVLSMDYIASVAEIAQARGLKLHMDGARVFNAAAALDIPVSEIAAPFDSLTFCLSKGLSAPVGSVLVGSHEFIRVATRIRKQLGGGMRQAGILAAAGIVSLEQVAPRLQNDHARAKTLAKKLSGIPGLLVEKDNPDSNMVYIQLAESVPLKGSEFKAQLLARGLKVGQPGTRRFRMVFHHWIGDAEVERVAQIIEEVLAG